MPGRSNLSAKLKNLRVFSDFVYSLVTIVLALLIGALLIFISGYDVSKAFLSFFDGAFGNVYNIAQTLLQMIPLNTAVLKFIP